jgi:hypothetical protein
VALKDPLVELYETLGSMHMGDKHFDVIVHAIQEIQHLRYNLETYQNSYSKELKRQRENGES